MNKRLEFADKWFLRSKEASNDIFDAFFCTWIALVVLSKELQELNGESSGRSDKDLIVNTFITYSGRVVEATSKLEKNTTWLAGRRGTRYVTPILDSAKKGKDLRSKIDKLADNWLGNLTSSDQEQAEATAELFNKVRNNLFHGGKLYDDQKDRELLEKITPIMMAIYSQLRTIP